MSSQARGGEEATREELLEKFPEPRRNTAQYLDNRNYHTDARSIRELYGVPPFDRENFDYPNLVPNVVDYSWESGPDTIAGGTDLLGVGQPGSGKSTFLNHLSLRALEVPESRVVWRASTSRSEWLPLAPWTTLCLPAGLDIDLKLSPRKPTESEVRLDVDEHLERIVREVVYYDDVRELNAEILEDGKFHVVYPDPRMRGIQATYDASDEKNYDAPSGRDELFHPEDPSKHFWFGWILDRIENGPYRWTTLVLDEIGDIAPEDASKDSFGTYQKVELLKDCWVDARKKGLSIYSFGHAEQDIHNLIRNKIRWRVTMNGTANPTTASSVVGFGNVPMHHDLTSRMKTGEALIWNQQNFEKISWPDYSIPVSHKLEVSLGGGIR